MLSREPRRLWVLALACVGMHACADEVALEPVLVGVGADVALGPGASMVPPLEDGDELPIVRGAQGLLMALVVPRLRGPARSTPAS